MVIYRHSGLHIFHASTDLYSNSSSKQICCLQTSSYCIKLVFTDSLFIIFITYYQSSVNAIICRISDGLYFYHLPNHLTSGYVKYYPFTDVWWWHYIYVWLVKFRLNWSCSSITETELAVQIFAFWSAFICHYGHAFMKVIFKL